MTKEAKAARVIQEHEFQDLLDALTKREYQILGPTVESNAVVYDSITTVDELPIGWVDHLDAGEYRLVKSRKKTFFGFVASAHSWKRFLHPAEQKLWDAKRDGRRFTIEQQPVENSRRAFLGVRPCELQAISIHDTVLTQGPHVDQSYEQRRKNLFIIAVNCVNPGGTCFCASMNTGPKATSGFDLSLTEILDSNRHFFLVEIGSKAGLELIDDLGAKPATEAEIETADKIMQRAANKMNRSLDAANIRELLLRKFDDPHWEQIADRCLTCGNCTMVCPTCFCFNIEDVTDLTGQEAERLKKWDSCFVSDYSYIHGGCIRSSTMSRYRQWMMHKLAYWVDQFGMSGCVGCGRRKLAHLKINGEKIKSQIEEGIIVWKTLNGF
jgi:hypothetical protein